MEYHIYAYELFSFTIINLAILFTGLVLSYLGFKLFVLGVTGYAAESIKANVSGIKVALINFTPGAFFALLGTIIICFTINKISIDDKLITNGKRDIQECRNNSKNDSLPKLNFSK